MKSTTLGLVTGLATLGLMAMNMTPALAATDAGSAPVSLGVFNAWTAWKGADTNGEMCYISSDPTTSLPAGVNRDPVHFLVINRIALGTTNEVQTLIGYPFKTDGTPTATIDGKSYPMVSDGSAAWLASTGDEPGFVTALKAGSTLVVKGTSQRGTDTTDTYSLSGATAAWNEIEKSCK